MLWINWGMLIDDMFYGLELVFLRPALKIELRFFAS
jgi:hypothetical protein